VTLGKTTFAEIRKKFGAAQDHRVGKEEESDIRICYSHRSAASRIAYVAFDSGPMGGFSTVTSFQLSVDAPLADCVSTEIDIGGLKTATGIHLGQSIKDFEGTVAVPLETRGNALSYEGLSRRKMSATERQPETPDSEAYFDVTVSLEARFEDDRLSTFRVERFESN
jgi:hypothetical protein